MRVILIITSLFLSAITTWSQGSGSVDMKKLVVLAEKSDFRGLTKLARSYRFIVFDSAVDKDGSVFYYARDPKPDGSVLSCSTDPKLKIQQMTFITYSRDEYLVNKSLLKQMQFKSSGITKKDNDEIKESEDFEKGSLLIATAMNSKQVSTTSYEFLFVKW